MTLDLVIDVKFSDNTLIEGKGNYNNIQKIFEEDPVPTETWMLESEISIFWRTEDDSPLPMNGFFQGNIHCFNNGDIVVMDCNLPKGISRDIEVFSTWAQMNHWNRPKVHDDFVNSQLIHWKHYWDTYLIDSDLIEKKFGKRESNQFDIDSDNQDTSN